MQKKKKKKKKKVFNKVFVNTQVMFHYFVKYIGGIFWPVGGGGIK